MNIHANIIKKISLSNVTTRKERRNVYIVLTFLLRKNANIIIYKGVQYD